MSEMRLSETYLSEPKTNLQTRGLPFTADDRAAAFGLLPARVSRPWRVSSHPPSPLAAGISSSQTWHSWGPHWDWAQADKGERRGGVGSTQPPPQQRAKGSGQGDYQLTHSQRTSTPTL